MAREVKGKVIIEANTKGVDKAADAVESLQKEILELSQTQSKSAESARKLREAIKHLDATGDSAGDEMQVLNNNLDKVGAGMHTMAQDSKDLTNSLEQMEGATADQVQEIKRLDDITRDMADAQSELNTEVHEGTSKSEAAAQAKREHEVASERLELALDNEYQASKAVTDATQQHTTGLSRLNLEQDENYIAVKSSTDANLRHVTSLKQMDLQTDQAYISTRALSEATQRAATEEQQATIKVKAATTALIAKKRVTLENATAEERARHETRLYGVEVGKLKESLVTAVAAGGVAGIVFKGLQIIGDGFRRVTEAAKDFQRQATETFSSVEEEVARTKAQIPDLVASQEALFTSTVRTARELGRGPLEVQTAMRKAMNLGLDYNEAMNAVSVATDAARVANADMTETLVTAMTAVNAFGEGVYTINEVLDQYSYIVQNSNLEMQDLISGMAKIISPAAEAGISIEEVSAAMITMNRQGDDFAEIGTLLGNLLTQLAIGGTTLGEAFQEAAGVGFREFTAAGGTLMDGLVLIEEHAAATNQSVSELVIGTSKFYRDQRAGLGVLELTGRHQEELKEAFDGAGEAVGTLDKQTKEFEGTLYLATEQMNSAKEAAYALEGSLTKNYTVGMVNFKETLYDLSAGLSTGIVVFNAFTDAIDANNSAYGRIQIFEALKDIVPYDDPLYEQKSNDLLLEAARLLTENKDISLELLEILVREFYYRQYMIDLRNEEFSVLTTISDMEGKSVESAEDKLAAQQEATELAKEQYTIAVQLEQVKGRQERVDGILNDLADRRAEKEQKIIDIMQEQNALIVSAYKESKEFVDDLSDLQIALEFETDPEKIKELEEAIIGVGDAIETHYRQTLIDSMVTNGEFTNEIVDLEVKLGLITEEAGKLKKEMILTTAELELLGKAEGFDELSLDRKAAAWRAVAGGMMSAQEAIDDFDPSNWRVLDMPPGIGGDFVDPVQHIKIPSEDIDNMRTVEEQLTGISDGEWEAVVKANTKDANDKLKTLEEYLTDVTKARTITIDVAYNYPSGGPTPAARGMDMTIPDGYTNDDFLIGVSSGEHVSVTPVGQPVSGGGVNIEVINQFATGVHNPRQVASASRDGLYAALEKAGLV